MIFLSQLSINFGMLGPVEPSLWRFDYPIKNLLGEKQLNIFFDTFHTLFAASLIYLGIKIYKSRNLNL